MTGLAAARVSFVESGELLRDPGSVTYSAAIAARIPDFGRPLPFYGRRAKGTK